MIERVLDELDRELAAVGVAGRLKRRILVESEDHLRSDPGAVERFGPPRRLAVEVARLAYPRMLLRSALAYAAAVVLFVLPLYGIPENTLPPAPWVDRPDYLTWKMQASAAAFAIASVFAVAAALAAWRRWTRLSLASLAIAGGALGVCGAMASVLSVQWTRAVSGGGTTLLLTLTSIVLIGGIAAAALASAERVRRLSRDLPS